MKSIKYTNTEKDSKKSPSVLVSKVFPYLFRKVGDSFLTLVFLALFVFGITYAINFPGSVPGGETQGGKFMSYFNKMLVSTGTTSNGTIKRALSLWRDDGTPALLILSGASVFAPGTIEANVFSYTSDERLKKNITTLDDSLEKILKLRGVNYEWRDSAHTGTQIGLIAQEIEKIYPELVLTNNGAKSVSYGNLVAPLIEAIKAQQLQIKELQQEVRSLKQQ